MVIFGGLYVNFILFYDGLYFIYEVKKKNYVYLFYIDCIVW